MVRKCDSPLYPAFVLHSISGTDMCNKYIMIHDIFCALVYSESFLVKNFGVLGALWCILEHF